MGTFLVRYRIENVVDRTKSAVLSKMLVDTSSEYTSIPAATLERLGIEREKKDVMFVMANGQNVSRSVGLAIIRLDKYFTVDEAVFAEKATCCSLGKGRSKG